MPIQLESLTAVTGHVHQELFGANILFNRDQLGDGTFDDAVDYLEIQSVRYPGGGITERFFDVNTPNAQFTTDPNDGSAVEILPLSDFMAFSAQQGFKPIIVLPTRTLLSDGNHGERHPDPAALEDMRVFVRDVLNGEYGDTEIRAFELGNEYWRSGEMTGVEYGRVSSAMAEIIQEEIDIYREENDVDDSWEEPDIAVQIGQYGQFSTEPGYIQNRQIMDEFNDTEAEAVDAVVGHFYSTGGGFDSVTNDQWFFDRMNWWETDEKFGDLDILVTEWNTDWDKSPETGLQHASTYLHMMSEMIAQGVDGAWAWPVQQNTPNDLFGDEGDIGATFAGEMHRLMSENLIGSRLVGREVDGDFVTYAFADSEGNETYFIVNRSDEISETSLQFGDALQNASASSSILIGTDGDPSDHKADPILTSNSNLDIGDGELSVSLRPYEVQMIRFEGVSRQIFGADDDDLIHSTALSENIKSFLGEDIINAGAGDDSIDSGGGSDTIYCGEGNDFVSPSFGRDTVSLEAGDDIYFDHKQGGHYGEDTVSGGDGDDTIRGYGGNDVYFGGAGNDAIRGTVGDNTIGGGTGNDTISGGAGDDLVRGGSGADDISLGAGDDTFSVANGDLTDWDKLNGDKATKLEGLDKINDFRLGEDTVDFSNFDSVSSMADLKFWKTMIDDDVYYTVQVVDTNERFLLNVDDQTTWSQMSNSSNFEFNDGPEVAEDLFF